MLAAVDLTSTVSPSDLSAMESTKRQCLEVISWDAVALEKLTATPPTKNEGYNFAKVKIGAKALVLNLTPGKVWLDMPFGFDVGFQAKNDKVPAFLGGESSTKVEYLSVVINIDSPELIAFLTELEEKNKALGEEAFPGQTWVPSVKIDAHPTLKVRVIVHNSSARTNIIVVNENKTIEEGKGYDFLKPILDRCNNLKRCGCKAEVELSRIWSNKGQCGAVFEVRKLVVNAVSRNAVEDEFVSTEDERTALLASLE